MTEKLISEKEAVKRERKAYIRALNDRDTYSFADSQAERAAKVYPLPKVTRPRVVREGQPIGVGDLYEWSLRDGHMRFRLVGGSGEWLRPDGYEGGAFEPTPARIALWADLFATPNELAEDNS